MSLDGRNEMEQLDGLAGELTEAGRLARVAIVTRQRPEPAFATRLRAELLLELPSGETVTVSELAADDESAPPRPPFRPLNGPEIPIERRRESRPVLVELRAWAPAPDVEVLVPAPTAVPEAIETTGIGDRRVAPAKEIGDGAPLASGKADETGHVAALHPAMHWRIPTRVTPSRWTVAGLAASVAIATLVYGSSIFSMARARATAEVAVSATLVRDGTASALATGADLREGDEIRVASDGRATLTLGASIVRLDSGADLKLDSLDPNHEVVSQLGGRAYHRVRVPTGGDYRVITGLVSWAARGTAFDLERYFTIGGGEEVRGLALQHGVDLDGPQFRATLDQGKSATIQLRPDGAPGGPPVVGAITGETLASQWLVDNAGLDARLGLPLGLLADLATPAPTLTPAPPTDQPAPPSDQVAPPTDQTAETPSPSPTATPTRPPTPKPTSAGPAYLGQLKITRNSDGTYKFQWPKYTGSGFQYYKLVHGPSGSQPSFPDSPYWACNDTPGNNVWSGPVDAGDYAVRVQVVDESGGKVVIRAQTNVVHLTALAAPSLPPTVDLGALTATPNGCTACTFSWNPYTGGAFDYYKLVYEPTASGKDPSYPGGSSYWAAPGAGDTSAGPITIPPGDYKVRIQAIGYPNGAYAYAQTTVLHLVVAAPTPTPTPTLTPTPTP